ncbi:hypothetical protein K435DRAFT_653008, partial [Dendrothele bispora CBS 962.96]
IRVWMLKIPIPGVPALPLAILPISSTYKAPQLSKYQIKLLRGMISHSFTVISNSADGAAVERDCQRRSATIGTNCQYSIRYPGGQKQDFHITYSMLDGKHWVNVQDSLHLRKTARNNAFTGARNLLLGDFEVNYSKVHALGTQSDSPIYQRDIIKYDKQDDNAAARLFSAAMLEHASQSPSEYMGLIVYLFLFGEFVDAYQSRIMSHYDRATIVLRTLIFLEQWRVFLKKSNYPENLHFISPASYDICRIAGNGLLALMIIHRDHLPCKLPLIPHQHGTDSVEHIYAEMRKLIPDFSMQQAILMVPKLTRISKSIHQSGAKFSTPTFKATASGYQHAFLDDADLKTEYEKLSHFPSDQEFSTIYQTAYEESEALWMLLGVPYPWQHLEVATESSISLSPDSAGQEDESDEEEELEDIDSSMRNQLNEMIENIDNDLSTEDSSQTAAIQEHIARIVQNPRAVTTLLRNAALLVEKPISEGNPLVYHLQDITTDDITPLASIRRSHQTIQAQNGVRNADSESKSNTSESTTSHRRELAQKMHAILRQADERGSSTGLNRKIRFTATDKPNETTATPVQKSGGNSANAEVAARGRASEVIKRRREIFKKNVKMHDVITEAMVSKSTLISRGTYGFVVSGEKILLGHAVTSLYSKGGGKVGLHSWVLSADSIGALSYISAQLYEPSGRRKQFNTVHVDYATVLGRGLRRFAHVPSNSFLVLLAKDDVAVVNNGAQLSDYAWSLYQDLLGERAEIVAGVVALNKRRRTKKGISEDVEDEVDETYH